MTLIWNLRVQLIVILAALSIVACRPSHCSMRNGAMIILSTDKYSNTYLVFSDDSLVVSINRATVVQTTNNSSIVTENDRG